MTFNKYVSCFLEEPVNASSPSCARHTFHPPADVELLRAQLLRWYDENQRELPWRTLVKENISPTGSDKTVCLFESPYLGFRETF